MTRDGYLLTQDDPFDHAVEFITAEVEGEVREFEYDLTLTEADESGEEVDVAWYKEVEDDDG